MRTRTALEQEILTTPGKAYQAHWEFWVEDPDGVYVNLSALAGKNWQVGFERIRGIDQPVPTVTVELWREDEDGSLAPLMGGSPLNRDALGQYKRLLNAGRGWYIRNVLTNVGNVPAPGDWWELIRGQIDDVNWPERKSKITLACRDLGGILLETTTKDELEFGVDGQSLEAGLQLVLDHWKPGVQIYVPVATGLTIPKLKVPRDVKLLPALREEATRFAMDLRYLWDAGTSSFRLTLYTPDRDKEIPDLTISPSLYKDIRQLSISRLNVRNSFTIWYPDKNTGKIERIDRLNQPSIDEYEEFWMGFEEGPNSPLDDAVKASAFLGAADSDVSEPLLDQEVEMMFFPHLELGDLLELEPNNIHHDSAQKLAALTIRDRVYPTERRTWVQGREKPAGMFLPWFRRARRSGGTPGAPVVAHRIELSAAGDTADIYVTTTSPLSSAERIRLHVKEEDAGAVWSLVASGVDATPRYVASGSEVGPADWFHDGATFRQVLSSIDLRRDQVRRIQLQAEGGVHELRSDWISIALDLKAQPWIEGADLVWDGLGLVLSATGGAHCQSGRWQLSDDNFATIAATEDLALADGQSVSRSWGLAALGGDAARGNVWKGRVVPFNGPLAAGAATGLSGVPVTDSEPIPAEAPAGGVSFALLGFNWLVRGQTEAVVEIHTATPVTKVRIRFPYSTTGGTPANDTSDYTFAVGGGRFEHSLEVNPAGGVGGGSIKFWAPGEAMPNPIEVWGLDAGGAVVAQDTITPVALAEAGTVGGRVKKGTTTGQGMHVLLGSGLNLAVLASGEAEISAPGEPALANPQEGEYLRGAVGGGSWERILALPWADLNNVPAYASRWPAWIEVTGKPTAFDPTAHDINEAVHTGVLGLAKGGTGKGTAWAGDSVVITAPDGSALGTSKGGGGGTATYLTTTGTGDLAWTTINSTLPATVAYEDEANVFTMPQTVRGPAATSMSTGQPSEDLIFKAHFWDAGLAASVAKDLFFRGWIDPDAVNTTSWRAELEVNGKYWRFWQDGGTTLPGDLWFTGTLTGGTVPAARITAGTFGAGSYMLAGTFKASDLRATNNIWMDEQYGSCMVGLYDATRLQGVWAMGTSYRSQLDGLGSGTLYGLAWGYQGYHGFPAGISHALGIYHNGGIRSAIGLNIWTVGSVTAKGDLNADGWCSVNIPGSSTSGGITLYGGDFNFGIAMRYTTNGGTHGQVTDAWATYFAMAGATNRGWIFKNGALGTTTNNVASLSGHGHLDLNGRVRATHAHLDGSPYGVFFEGGVRVGSASEAYVEVGTTGTGGGIRVWEGGAGAFTNLKGYLFWNSAGFGLLHSGGGWAVRCNVGAVGGELYGSWTVGGSVTATTFYTSSALDQKRDVLPYTDSALALLRRTDLYSYRFKKDPAEQRVGFIADWTDPLLSGLDRRHMKVETAIGVAFAAIKEQDDEVTRLRRRVEYLENQLGIKEAA